MIDLDNLVTETITLEKKAGDLMWDAAKHYHQAVTTMKISAAEFGRLVGRDERHTQRMVKVWKDYSDPAGRIDGWSFWDHYRPRHTGSENLSDPHSTDEEFLAAFHKVLSLIQDRATGDWVPEPLTEAQIHFGLNILAKVITGYDNDELVSEIEGFLKEEASK